MQPFSPVSHSYFASVFFLYPTISLGFARHRAPPYTVFSLSLSRSLYSGISLSRDTADEHEGAHASSLVLKYHATTESNVFAYQLSRFRGKSVALSYTRALLFYVIEAARTSTGGTWKVSKHVGRSCVTPNRDVAATRTSVSLSRSLSLDSAVDPRRKFTPRSDDVCHDHRIRISAPVTGIRFTQKGVGDVRGRECSTVQ